MGIELLAHGGRLVHVRETGRVDEMWDEDDEPCGEPAGWEAFIGFCIILGVMIALAIYT